MLKLTISSSKHKKNLGRALAFLFSFAVWLAFPDKLSDAKASSGDNGLLNWKVLFVKRAKRFMSILPQSGAWSVR